MSNLANLPSSFGNSLNPGFLAKGVSAEFHGVPGGQKSAITEPSSSFTDSLGSFLSKTLSGGMAIASVAMPGASLGLSKLGDAAAGTLLHGLLNAHTPSTPNKEMSPLAGITAATGQMMPRHPYQAQPSSFPGASFITSA
jgi:hypothetical protein